MNAVETNGNYDQVEFNNLNVPSQLGRGGGCGSSTVVRRRDHSGGGGTGFRDRSDVKDGRLNHS